MSMLDILDIGAVAQQSGVSPATLRYYEKIGLIASVGRRGLRRQFKADVLLRLALIGLAQSADFSLIEICAVLGKDSVPNLPRARLHAKADEIERQIDHLGVIKNALRHVADCPASTHLECPIFRRLLLTAVRHKKRKRGAKA